MHTEFTLILVVWVITVAILGIYYWRKRESSAGVVLTYVALFSGSHAMQGAVYAMPWYTPRFEPALIFAGFVQSTIGLISLAVTVMIFVPVVRQAIRKSRSSLPQTSPMLIDEPQSSSRLPMFYIATGLIAYFILTPIFSSVPTVSAFIGGLYRLVHIGLALAFWQVFTSPKRNSFRLFVLIGLTMFWPLVTITNEGFLGFGLWPTVFIFIFVMLRQRRYVVPLVLILIAFYLGLSLIVTYYGERPVIRGVVWGESEFETRVNTLIQVIEKNTRAFNIYDGQQLSYIDERLGLNRLVGLGIRRLDTGINQYAGGETILNAALMIIPRAIWPEKPIELGGQAMVNLYTGVYMYGDTTVALGQVLEFYVNFGTVGVIAGFIVFGLLLAAVDQGSVRALKAGNYYSAALWLIPAFGLLLPENNLIAVVGSSVSGWLTLVAFNMIPFLLFSSRWRTRLGGEAKHAASSNSVIGDISSTQ
ncbi:MAG: hypothetical protein KJ065_03235 [Anaerolineae bacterium]|nr:hypothetical protein [Anaerolineae bacterium]